MWMEIAQSFQSGNNYIYFILGLSFIGFVVLFERIIMIQFVYNINFKKFLENLKKAVKASDFDRAAAICKGAGKSSLATIGLKAIEAAENDPQTVRSVIEEEALTFLPMIDRRIHLLPTLATIILLTGVLGTINSLWSAFHSVDVLDTAQKQAMVGHGIANSLSYSALGLVVSIIVLASHQLLRGMTLRLIDNIQLGITVITNLLAPAEMNYVAMGAGAPAAAPATSLPMPEPVAAKPIPPPVAEVKEEDASSEEATVEDIKDEEEII